MLQTCWCHVACEPGEVVRLAQDAFLVSPHSSKFLPTPLIRPQPVVTHVRPSGSASFEEARQTGETLAVYWAGEASFRRVTSLLRVLAFQLGCVIACGAEPFKGHVELQWVQALRWDSQGTPRTPAAHSPLLHGQPVLTFEIESTCTGSVLEDRSYSPKITKWRPGLPG